MVPLIPPAAHGEFPFVPGEYRIRHVVEEWERDGCFALRRKVFCEEQKLFERDDFDAADAAAITISAIACVAAIPERVVGTVRIHQLEPGRWQGSRLAVHSEFRGAAWIGTELIRHAVRTAHALGCREFLAQVQQQNVRLFQSLHWTATEMLKIRDRPHVLMSADLRRYPPRAEAEISFFTGLRKVA